MSKSCKGLVAELVKCLSESDCVTVENRTFRDCAKEQTPCISSECVDEEFGRQTLAGINPLSIQLVKEWPLKSKLDPAIYGPPESAITTDVVEMVMLGRITVEQIIVIFCCHMFTKGKDQWKEVYLPGWDSTSGWLWKLAKAQFLALDSGYHQLISHWLRTHCLVEPYVIATNQQLSALHPIYRLLKPYLRYTMKINALARQGLINADGIIEPTFSPGKYNMEISSATYRELWRFDHEGLPADLIKRI
ncbi:hypothetical protein POM88_032588 [Heracleum sosnowskyi]|uniref:Lipoxygenase domain-containing protein n=1 Tax=Heracleum sosnowskyi TaxID=360622 RepID=A0AAD8MHN4_9APIA|nr:hypothetical protein POM88_032588 [Heracleum sosnowskyi]